jgi:Tol biopolymer transport system component
MWVYFTSKRTGSWEIWKAAADGRSVEQVTTGGGWSAKPSRDGERLFFMRGPLDQAAIWQIDLDSGENTEILSPNLAVDQMAVAPTGLYYIPKADQENRRFLWYFDFDSGERKVVTELEGSLLQCALCMDWEKAGFSVSPEGDYLLFGQVEEFDSNLFLVENFR